MLHEEIVNFLPDLDERSYQFLGAIDGTALRVAIFRKLMSSSGSSGDVYAETLLVFDQRDDPFEPLTTPEVAESLDAARRTVYKRLEKLVSRGELKTKKVGANARVWWRSTDGSSKSGHTRTSKPRRGELESTVEEVLERITDGFYGLDEQFRFTYVNNRAESLLDVEQPAVLGQDIHDKFVLTDEFEAALHEAHETQEPVFLEDYYDPLDAWFENAIYPSETGLSIYFRDISKRKRHENQLEEHQTIVETVDDGVFTVDATNHFSMVNQAYADMLGYTRDELIGTHASQVASEEYYTEGKDLKANLEGVGEVAQHELELETKDGDTVPVEIRFTLLPAPEGDEHGVVAVVRDVTERKARERELEESRQRYKMLVENFPNGAVGLLDEDLRYVALGGEVFEEFSTDELRGNTVYDHLPPELLDVLVPKYRAAFNGERSDFEIEHDGRVRQFRVLPIYDENGEIHRIMAMSQDITDRKRAEEKLRENEAWLSEILEQLPAAVGVFDTDGHFRLQNDRMRDLAMGDRIPSRNSETRGEWIAVDDGERLSPEQWPGARALRGEAVSPGIEFRFEGDDESRWMDVAAMPISESGETTEAIVVIQDITERKQREEELEQYKTIIETAEDAVYFVDDEYRFVLVNDAYCDLVGRSREELLGEHITVVVSEEIAGAARELRAEAADSGTEGDKFEMDFTTSDGGIRNTEVNYSYLRDKAGNIKGVAGIIRDVTERKRREEELAALNRLNAVFQDVTHAIIESSSREEIEQTITEHLTSSDSYEYAWIGHLDRHGENIVPQSAGTNEVELSEISFSATTDDPTSFPPAAEAIQTGEVQVTYDSTTDPVFDQWNESQDSRQQGGISIPVTYEERVYGVLTVYTARENAFDENERRIIGRLGGVVGHAISAIERKQALLEDRVQEITFQSQRFAEVFTGAAGDESFTISIEKFVPLPDDQSIAYYALDGLDPAVFIDVIETFNPDAKYHVTDEEESWARVEVQGSDLTLASELAKYNSRIVDGTLQYGEFRLRVQVPQHSHIREVIEIVKRAYPDAEVVAQTEVERENPRLSDVFSDLDDHLTERQRTTLEVGYYSGFFDWPRTITGEELAERLDVTPGTVSHHLRHGEHKLMGAFFE